jgi:hypothetical protein
MKFWPLPIRMNSNVMEHPFMQMDAEEVLKIIPLHMPLVSLSLADFSP